MLECIHLQNGPLIKFEIRETMKENGTLRTSVSSSLGLAFINLDNVRINYF